MALRMLDRLEDELAPWGRPYAGEECPWHGRCFAAAGTRARGWEGRMGHERRNLSSLKGGQDGLHRLGRRSDNCATPRASFAP